MFLVCKLEKLIAGALCVIIVAFVAFFALRQIPRHNISTFIQTDAAEVPILMYHSILKDPSKTGEYVITPAQFKSDLAYLQDNGYHSVVIKDLIDYVNNGTPLPEKPVMLTFDDGHLNNLIYAGPLLAEYNMRAVLSIVGEYTDIATERDENNASYSYLTWDQVKQAHESGIFEIQNHSNDMHYLKGRRKGALQVSGESVEMYKQALFEDLVTMQQKVERYIGVSPTTFTYPFGLISKNSAEPLHEIGFQATLTCEQGINHIERGNPNKLFGLKRMLRSGKVSAQAIMKELDASR